MYLFNSWFAFLALLAAKVIIGIHILAGFFSPQLTYVEPPASPPAPVATTSQTTAAPSTTPQEAPAVRTATPLPAVTSSSTPAAALTPSAPPPTPLTADQIEQINQQTRAALVNILCTTKAGGSFAPISGSGVFIDNRGIILTNAHVAQFFLLRDYLVPGNIDCVIRIGSPAQAAYTAELLYLPPAWITANAAQILSSHSTGTGENDYAFLRVTGTTNSAGSMPASFPAMPMALAEPDIGAQVLLAAYPAAYFGGATIQMNLYSSSAITGIKELYSFSGTQQVDLVSLGDTVVTQSGSSGGAVVNLDRDSLIGLISTESAGTTTSSRTLYGITLSYINRGLAGAGKGGIAALLLKNPEQEAKDFATNVAPSETQALETVLNKTR